jgi:UDP-N-acetylglucosamine--dolichyl-phosphate N-acetylglucosaminephosphotransferase
MTTSAPGPAPVVYGHPLPRLLMATLTPIALALIVQPLLPLLLPGSILSTLPVLPQATFPALQANLGFSMLAFVGAAYAVPAVSGAFVDKGLKGRDLLKPGGRTSGPWM